ncbi:MAG: helix-turn-helix transcriptional regulator [Acidobacteriota bacterium]
MPVDVAGDDDRTYSDAVNATPSSPIEPRQDRPADGAVLAVLRAYRRISQRNLARRTGVHHASISRYERGLSALGEKDRCRLLDGLELPEDAWEAVASLVDWLDWLAERHELWVEGEDGPGSALDRRRRAGRLAESAGRERQRQFAELLDFLIDLNS